MLGQRSKDAAQAQSLVAPYSKWFDKFYIELQNHNINHGEFTDDALADSLLMLATHMGIPCVVTQDSHYSHEDEKDTHEALKRLVTFGTDSDDAVFPLADEVWLERHHSSADRRAHLSRD